MVTYPTAGSSMLPTWNTTQQPVNMSTQPTQQSSYYPGQNMSYNTDSYQGPLLPGQDVNAFRTTGVEQSGTGSVLGTSTVASPTSTPAPASKPSGGFDKMDRNANPGDGYFWDAADGWKPTGGGSPGYSQADLDNAYRPIFDVYNQAESNLRGQLPSLISEAEAQARASAQLLGNQRQSADEQLGLQESQTNAAKQAQEAQQRQTFQELQLANRQRFGGASSAGQAASEIQGREFQRNQYQIGQQAQEAIMQINTQKQAVERDYSQKMYELDNQKVSALNQINRTFQDRLLEINSGRAGTEAEKAQQRMSALQELRNQAFQIQAAEQQFRQQLQLQAQQTQAELDALAMQYGQTTSGAVSAGGSAASQFGSYTPIPQSSVQTQTTGTTNPALTGQVSRDDENQGLIGSIRSLFGRQDPYSYAGSGGGAG